MRLHRLALLLPLALNPALANPLAELEYLKAAFRTKGSNLSNPAATKTLPAQLPQSAQASNKKTPEQTRTQLLQKLIIDRTTSGILEARLEEKRISEKEAPKQPKVIADAPELSNAQKNQAKLKQYQEDIKTLRHNVTLGEWTAVKEALEQLPDNDAKIAFSRIVHQLGAKVQVRPRPELTTLGAKSHSQDQYLRPNEVLALSDSAKKAPDQATLTQLSKLISGQKMPTSFFDALKNGTRYFGTQDEKAKHRTAEFLITANLLDQASTFLPDPAKAQEEKNYSSLNLLARFHAESHSADKGKQHLPQAWSLSLGIIREKKAPLNEKGIALYRALALVPELEGNTGKEWLTKTFSEAGREGFEILAAVGTLTAQTREHPSPDFRLEQLKLQAAATTALLGNPDIDLAPWKEVLTLYVRNWNAEAQRTKQLDTSSSMRPRASYDAFGNVYYGHQTRSTSYSRNVTPHIDSGDLLRTRPSDKWLSNIDTPVRLENLTVTAALFLKVKEEEEAFPILKTLATQRPEETKTLVREMIRVWAENNNPNQKKNYRPSYHYYSGYNQRAETIPLTRSKQERNLRKLSKFVTEVRALALDDHFEEEFSDAFIQAHSQAEVWRLESLEAVFGPIAELAPSTISSLLRRMRGNLAGLWPDPKVQAQAKTKRNDKQLKEQILRGYTAATNLCQDALEKHPKDWSLQIQKAAISYEKSNYQAKIGSHPEHSANKRFALDDLADAAAAYTTTLPLEEQKNESDEPFTTWFYAALGSPDLSALKASDQPIPSEFLKIKAALDALPEDSRQRHLDTFAKTINARLANVSADLKYRFLEAALPITGKHERIAESASIYEYYQDLVTEIQLDVHLDGPDRIDSSKPFGLFVNLRHTREIERESGGFQRYLINQNNSARSYNYGRPTEDYRDKFEKGARSVLAEHFEVISLTFHNSKVTARTDSEPGWTQTPYAYFLLKTKGPEIDSIPPLKIDLDFLDTSGYVVLPITSAAIPIDASQQTDARPYRDLSLTMILDEREAAEEKKIFLEIRAKAHGLVPDLKELIKLEFDGLTISETEDRELQLEELDATTDDGAPLSTHEWRLTLIPEGKNLPTHFHFPEVLVEISTKEDEGLLLQKYDDVDLISVENSTEILAGEEESHLFGWILAGILILGGFLAFHLLKKKAPVEQVITGPDLPSTLTPVTLLNFLENIQRNAPLDETQKAELGNSITSLKDRSFGPAANPPAEKEIHKIAKQWQQAATPRKAA